MKKSLHFHREIAYMNYVCEIREKNEIPEPIHVIFNEVCRFSCINVLYLLSHHGNNLSEYQNHGPPTIYHLCCLVKKKKSKENSAKNILNPGLLIYSPLCNIALPFCQAS